MECIVSKKYKDGEIVGNRIGFSNLQNCFNAIEPGSSVYLCGEQYYGKFSLNVKNITLLGTDETLITYDAYHGEKIRACDGGDGEKVYGTTGSATFTLKPNASGFKCFNVTFENSHKRIPEISNQAVAFKTETFGGFYENCKFIGNQDTLYVNEVDNVFKECYIVGDIDFIFGNGNAIFDRCTIEMNCRSHVSYITAPNTYISYSYGFLFYQCKILKSGTEPAYLGRPWFSSSCPENVMPRCLFYKCDFPEGLTLEIIKMHKANRDDHEMYYYKCKTVNGLVSNITDERHIDFYEKIYKEWQ